MSDYYKINTLGLPTYTSWVWETLQTTILDFIKVFPQRKFYLTSANQISYLIGSSNQNRNNEQLLSNNEQRNKRKTILSRSMDVPLNKKLKIIMSKKYEI